MQEVDSAALQLVAKSLQLSTRGSMFTEFQDDLVQQTLDVAGPVRRGLIPLASQGIFAGTVTQQHIGADTQENGIQPYALIDAAFPNLIGKYDIWFLDVRGEIIAGAGDLIANGMRISLTEPSAHNLQAAATISSWFEGVAGVTTFVSVKALQFIGNRTTAVANIRLARDATLTVESTSTAAVNIAVVFRFLMMPLALGQDGAV